MTDLLALADRAEAATGPDRDIDVAIAPLIGVRVVEHSHPLGRRFYDKNGADVLLPRFTASLDAAMSLVPEGWEWRLYSNSLRKGPEAQLQRDKIIITRGATPALALTAACLRAHAQGRSVA